LKLTVIAFGTLSESFFRDAFAEYQKRLGPQFSLVQLKETKLSREPSQSEIDKALAEEADRILSAVPKRAAIVALCVEGKELTSPELAAYMEKAAMNGGEICFLIGSSYGLSEKVKEKAALRLSLSKLTMPHQLARVVLAEALYRSTEIIKGSKYHK